MAAAWWRRRRQQRQRRRRRRERAVAVPAASDGNGVVVVRRLPVTTAAATAVAVPIPPNGGSGCKRRVRTRAANSGREWLRLLYGASSSGDGDEQRSRPGGYEELVQKRAVSWEQPCSGDVQCSKSN
ncbi:unnamed protein product, partial [Phaeothamnion confervicola]